MSARAASVLALALLLAGPVSADVVREEPGEGGLSGLRLLPDGPFRLTCWQNGAKIIDEDGLSELSIALSRFGTRTSARSLGTGDTAVLFAANAYTTCMVKGGDRRARSPAASNTR